MRTTSDDQQLRSRQRQAPVGSADRFSEYNDNNNDEDASAKLNRHDDNEQQDRLRPLHWLLLVVYCAALHSVCVQQDASLPAVQDEADLDVFSETRARRWLETLVKEGPRPTGSWANEVHAKAVIREQLAAIEASVNTAVHRLAYSTQTTSGCFTLGFLSRFTECYADVDNILVRFGPNSGSAAWNEHAVLVNCHYDTMPDSPGAGDDGVSCAIMLEVLRVLARQATPLKHDVIMLFNGAEENFLQASHGFITQHAWRHHIRAFVNLEGAGAGGKEILFQAGPGNAWLLKTYMEHAPHPHACVLAQEVFQSGVFPSDTDFRIFRDYGRVPGLDIAYVRNGYVYHSEFDLPKFISAGSMQRSGENLLAVVSALANSPFLSHPAEYHEGQWVFFDVFGKVTFWYSQTIGHYINLTAFVLVLCKVAANVLSHNSQSYGVRALLVSLAAHVVSLLAVVASGLVLTQVVGRLNLSMIWYARPWVLLPVYVLPMILSGAAVYSAFIARTNQGGVRLAYVREQAHFDACTLVSALIMFVMICARLASAYFVMINVFSELARTPVLYALRKSGVLSGRHSVLLAHVLALLPMSIMSSYGVILVLDIFIPTMGRIGGILNPEYFVYAVAILIAFVLLLHLSSLLYISASHGRVLRGLLLCTLGLWALLPLTRMSHAYHYDADQPRCRRTITLHSTRELYSIDDKRVAADNFVWHQALDYRGAADLPVDGMIGREAVVPNCSRTVDAYCQLPYFGPTAGLFLAQLTLMTPTPEPPPLKYPLDIELVERTLLDGGRLKLSFRVTGSDHQSLHITPWFGWQVDRWSFTDERSLAAPNSTLFLFLLSSNEPKTWNFWLVLRQSGRPSERWSSERIARSKLVQIAFAQHYTHGEAQNSARMTELRRRTAVERQREDSWRWAATLITGCAQLIARWY